MKNLLLLLLVAFVAGCSDSGKSVSSADSDQNSKTGKVYQDFYIDDGVAMPDISGSESTFTIVAFTQSMIVGTGRTIHPESLMKIVVRRDFDNELFAVIVPSGPGYGIGEKVKVVSVEFKANTMGHSRFFTIVPATTPDK